MTTVDRRTTRRFPLTALLLAEPSTAPQVERVAALLNQGAVHMALGVAKKATYASYHPSAWGI